LVIDRSGSMSDPGATMGLTKWDELNAATDTALTQYESTIDFGLMMYPTGDECATEGPQVLFGPKNKTPIVGALQGTVPAGGTPTAAALNNAAASLTALGDPEAPKFVILATDGGPNCNYFLDASNDCSCTYAQAPYCCTSYPFSCVFGSSCLDDQGTLDVIASLGTQGIGTFVIGLPGTTEYEGLLNAMAIAGGHPQMGGTTDYYAVTDQSSLLTALQTIAVSVISCQIHLDMAPQVPDGVSVFIDGQEVPRDKTKTNGWDYTDDTYLTIELYGMACNELQNGDEHQLTATFECTVE
ncbi:MAG: VWA domain-containing protein, partial [Myxococcales bacterium]|nr:VWA domain-containing protein [Myxococcales bacterium]